MALSENHRRRRLTGGAAVGVLAAGTLTFGVTLPAHAETPTVINLLSINDFHGRINDSTVDFAETVEKLRQDSLIANGGTDNTLLVGAGDLIGASEFASAVAQDQPTIDVMNALGMASSAVGNHEFDQGFADLTDRVVPAADWTYLGANVYEKGTSTPALPEYAISTVNGLDVAVIGVVTQETPALVGPAGVAGLDFGDPVAAINRVADQLTDGDPANGEADVLVASIHEGAPAGETAGGTLESEVAASPVFSSIVNGTSPKVAAILNGHTHQTYAWAGPVPATDGEGIGATRPIIQTGSYGANVGQIQLTVDADTNAVLDYTVANVPVSADVVFDPTLGTPASIAEITGIVDAALAYADQVGSQQVGSVTADITTAFSGGTYGADGYGGADAKRDNRAAESSLGNLVADALLTTLAPDDLGGAQISLVNPGGLRAELLYDGDGVISYAEANAVLPFLNNLFTTTLTGRQLVAVLEQQWQTVTADDGSVSVPSRPYLQLGTSANMSYTFDPDPDKDGVTVGDLDDQGKHILSVTVDGKPVLVDDTFRVGSFSFLLQGGDNFTAFTAGTDTRDSGLIDRDAWIAFLQDNPGLSPSFAKHAVAVTTDGALPGAGGTGTLKVSNLDMTSLGAPANTTLEVGYVSVPTDGSAPATTVVGQFPISNGAADVSFTVPPVGTYLLVLGSELTETLVTLPLVVVDEQPTTPPTTPTATTTTTTTAPVATTTKTTAKPTGKPTKGLASTGISQEDTVSATVIATLLIALGGALVVAGRRRTVTGRHQG